jgi:phage gp36-like protein
MHYCTQQNLVDRYGQNMVQKLSDRATPATGQIDANVVEQALTDTDAIIDAYLRVRYQLPLAAVPALLADLAKPIAIYKLHRQEADPKILYDYEDARKQLQNISAGILRLDVAGVEPASGQIDLPQTNSPARPLASGTMAGMI